MGHRSEKRHRPTTKAQTLPSSPTHSFTSSSSSEFEFSISVSPRKSSADLCPADELFYKGQLLPLHPSPRLSMVRTLLLSSSSTSSSSDTTTTASRDSTASSCDSSRPSSATDDEFRRLTTHTHSTTMHPCSTRSKPTASKYFSLPKFSSVFRKEQKHPSSAAAVKRVSSSAKEVICKYLKKVKPLYEKLSQKQQQQQKVSPPPPTPPTPPPPPSRSENATLFHIQSDDVIHSSISHSFSGNLRYPRGRSCFSSCPSSMGSSPSHGRHGSGYGSTQPGRNGSGSSSDASSMEELQNAIQGAILHCKNSMLQNKTLVSNEI